MIRFAVFLSSLLCGLGAFAQDAGGKLRLRSVLHDPLSPQADLYVQDEKGALVPLYLALEGLTEAQNVRITNGKLQLFDSAEYDPEKPLEHLAASVTVPERTNRAIAFLFPAGEGAKLPYRILMLPDDSGAFGKGESRVINMTPLAMAMKAGEHNVKLPSGKVAEVPKVTKLNDLNQAHTSFYRKGEGETEWILIAERPMQFDNSIRNIVLVYPMPNTGIPRLRTIIDHELAAE
ncbi:hypothetical protein HAHE_26790 [Haloferula helveola]|uniref:Uncharacterized protein n=1 Tax=Haloferula helveola TaxID=490095 RepID=A0ABM7RHG7_9BACT|nr:hypothetical protein HAHE_26790 [Haloferula helveola]